MKTFTLSPTTKAFYDALIQAAKSSANGSTTTVPTKIKVPVDPREAAFVTMLLFPLHAEIVAVQAELGQIAAAPYVYQQSSGVSISYP